MRFLAPVPCLALVMAMAGCGTRPVPEPGSHIRAEEQPARAAASIPQLVRTAPLPPPPEAREAEVKYSVVVANQPVREVLLAMARETRVNFDIHPGIEGTVNLNAIDQTLKQILNRMAKQVDMRWEMDGKTITAMPDTPFLRNYRVDYVNMSRDLAETVGVSTSVNSGTGTAGAASGTSGNNSTLTISNIARNRIWETLEKNLKDLLRETDKLLPEGSSETFIQGRGQGATRTTQARSAQQRRATGAAAGAIPGATTTITTPGDTESLQTNEVLEQKLTFREAAAVIVNPETGIISVRGTSRQHEKVAEFLQQIAGSARRQVLIEATIVEVTLSDQYQSGVDWSALGLSGLGYSFRQSFTGTTTTTTPSTLATSPSLFSIGYSNPNAAVGGSISASVKLLDTFGSTRVLSSPKLMVLNNQTAVLKVVENKVYFTLTGSLVAGINGSPPVSNFTTTQNTVAVGFVMNVTPQVGEDDVVILNVRPSVSSIVDFVEDPNPSLFTASGVRIASSKVPQIRTREMESVLRVASGQTAVLGGLMQDSFERNRDGLPVVSRIPIFGDAVSARNDLARKTELVIFIRPVVIRDASMEGDLAAYKRYLPDSEFFRESRPLLPSLERKLERIERFEMPEGTSTPNPVVPDPAPVRP